MFNDYIDLTDKGFDHILRRIKRSKDINDAILQLSLDKRIRIIPSKFYESTAQKTKSIIPNKIFTT